jgi:integrase
MPFKAAHDAGYIDINPNTKNTVRPVKDEVRNVEKDVFTSEQLSEFFKAPRSEDWTGAILCGYYTGLRLRDICRFAPACRRSKGINHQGNDTKNRQDRHGSDSSAIRCVARETNSRHREGAGVSNTGW